MSPSSSIRMFDAANGKPLRRIYIPGDFDIGSLAYSPDGQTLGGGRRRPDHQAVRSYDRGRATSAAGSRPGRALAQGRRACPQVVRGCRPVGPALALAFSPDGSLLVSGQESIGWLNGRTDESFLSIWDIASARH